MSQDEQLQGLLTAAGDGGLVYSSSSCSVAVGVDGTGASTGVQAGSAAVGGESVAALVQRWEKLEHAWQRSWWV
jgi:hypothetical protein